MSILMPMYKKWSDMIFDKEKPFEFRSRIGKDFNTGNKIYIYESSKGNGCQKVVGEATIKNVTRIEHTTCDATLFVKYYLENILKKPYYVKEWQKVLDIKLDKYNDFIKLSNIFCIDFLETIAAGTIDTFKIDRDFITRKKLSNEIAIAVEEWLFKIGYYNSYGESNYNYAIELCNIKKYDTPLELNNFTNKGETITKAPQSWCYCKKKHVDN